MRQIRCGPRIRRVDDGGVAPPPRRALTLTVDEGVAIAEAIEQRRVAIMEAVKAAMATTASSGLRALGENGRADWREELHYHLDYLAGSAIAGDPTLFVRYLAWLDQRRRARADGTGGLVRSLRCLREYLDANKVCGDFNALKTIIDQGERALTDGRPESGSDGAAWDLRAYHPWTESLLTRLQAHCEDEAYSLMGQISHREGYVAMALRLVQPALYRLGREWQISGAGAAAASVNTRMATLQRLLIRQLFEGSAAPYPVNGQQVIIGCGASSRHNFGLRFIAEAFELDGWQVQCLGADTPQDALAARIREKRPDLVVLSVATVSDLPQLQRRVEAIRHVRGVHAPRILAGGGGLDAVPQLTGRLNLDGWYADPSAVLAGE
jgi:methanogenic corrinoid protein MtbC1